MPVSPWKGLLESPLFRDWLDIFVAKFNTAESDITTLQTSVGLLNTVKDLTNATSDYALAVNETAKITITAASTPLNIAVEDGVYEIELEFDTSTFAADQVIQLLANGSTHSAEFEVSAFIGWTGFATDEVDVQDGFGAGATSAHRFTFGQTMRPWQATAKLIISSDRSTMMARTTGIKSSAATHFGVMTRWTNGPHTSLGTLSIGEAATGVCYVKRVA